MFVDMDQEISNLDWESLREFDDGHVPELCRRDQFKTTRIVEYPDLFERTPQVRVYSNAFPESLTDAVYQRAESSKYPSWGDYVTISDVQEFWDQKDDKNKNSIANRHDVDILSIELVAKYLELAMGEKKCCENKNSPDWRNIGSATDSETLFTLEDLKKAHGVAIWVLRSSEGSQVDYHLDYGEQIRYFTNIIVPPLLAGTLQCTRDKLEGGDFQVSLQGIQHYGKYGYKCKKKTINTTAIDDNSMVKIPYEFNQMICHLGNLPHSSTRVNSIQGDQCRVIVGFNVFCNTAGPFVQKAPEHSDRFRKLIQLQRYVSNTTNNRSQIKLKVLKENKALTKLLVLAKREHVKEKYRRSLDRLFQEVPKRLPASVQDLMAHFSDTDEGIPSEDVRVFLHQMLVQGTVNVSNGCPYASDGLVSPEAELAHIKL